MFKKVLVPLDGSTLSEEVLPAVTKLLEDGAGEVTLFITGEAPEGTRRRRKGLHRVLPIAGITPGPVVPDVLPAAPPAYAETRDQAVERKEHELLEYLDQVGRSLAGPGWAVRGAVHFGDPASEIIRFAKSGDFDLIVMATHGRSGLQETLHGSVTAQVIRSGPTPVLVVRPKKAERRHDG